MEKKKTTNIIITILVIIIIALGALVGLLATGTISFNKEVNNNSHKTNTKEKKDKEKEENKETNKEENKLLTNDEAIDLVKYKYNEDVKTFHDRYTFCNKNSEKDNSTSNSYFFVNTTPSIVSSSFHSIKELKNYLRNYLTENAINKSNKLTVITKADNPSINDEQTFYQKAETIRAESQNKKTGKYCEVDGKLYCDYGNIYGKGGPNLKYYQVNIESSINISNITNTSFEALVVESYRDYEVTQKTVITTKLTFTKEGSNWLIDSYEKVSEKTDNL